MTKPDRKIHFSASWLEHHNCTLAVLTYGKYGEDSDVTVLSIETFEGQKPDKCRDDVVAWVKKELEEQPWLKPGDKGDVDYNTCPEANMAGGFKNWVEHGIPPGSFGQAILMNDLTEAAFRAHPSVKFALGVLAEWVHWNLPTAARGSREKCLAWMDKHGVGRERWEL